MKQETLKEAAETMYPNKTTKGWIDQYSAIQRIHFIEGAKWMQERMYSEEEIDLLNKMFELYWYENNNEHKDNLEEWELSKKLFKQFKSAASLEALSYIQNNL